MKLRTDDDIYRARLLYLGPPGYTLPFQLPYAQWGLFALLCAGLVTAALLLHGGFVGACAAIGGAALATAGVWRHVDPDRPARKVLAVALTDWRATTTPPERLPSFSARHIRYFTTSGVRR